MIKKFPVLLTIPVIFFLDRISKMIIIHRYREGESSAVISKVFYLTRVNNTGAAFGILKGSAFLLMIVSLVCVLGLSVLIAKDFFEKKKMNPKDRLFSEKMRHYALILVIGGAAGNLYDRFFYGYVVDFLDFLVWPVFNIADIFISIGIFLILVSFFKTGKAF